MEESQYIKRHKLIEKEAAEKFRKVSDEEWDVTSDLLFGKDRHKYTEDNLNAKDG